MSFKTRRTNSRRNRVKRERNTRERKILISVGSGSCDCPICQAMGIDLDASNGVDVRPIDDPAEFERLLTLLDEVRVMPTE